VGFHLTKRVIRLLCGDTSYARGEAYHKMGRVKINEYDEERRHYLATVQGSDLYDVDIQVDDNGDVDAVCTCPAYFAYDNNCKHIAAVLLAIHDREAGEGQPERVTGSSLHGRFGLETAGKQAAVANRYHAGANSAHPVETATSQRTSMEEVLVNDLLQLFSAPPPRISAASFLANARTLLQVEFVLSNRPLRAPQWGREILTLELKLGPKRTLIVQRIAAFLHALDKGDTYTFSKQFTYDPKLHAISAEAAAVMRLLLEITGNESLYQQAFAPYHSSSSASSGNERALFIPPYAWGRLLPLLERVPSVTLLLEGKEYAGLSRGEPEVLPLTFIFGKVGEAANQGYQMRAHGLESLVVLEDYGLVFAEGKHWQLTAAECNQLKQLKLLLINTARHQTLPLSAKQLEPFLTNTVPGLRKLGTVRIAAAVSERLVQTPLKARLYLDRIKDRLVAGLEFHYGEIQINPLEGARQPEDGGPLLLRDGEQERLILQHMEESGLVRTESGYFTDNEEDEFEFLHHRISQLEKLLVVYATSAVKTRIQPILAPPRISVKADERMNWLDFQFVLDGIADAEIRALLRSLTEKRRYHRLPSGALVPLTGEALAEALRLAEELGIGKRDLAGAHLRLPLTQALHLLETETARQDGGALKLDKGLRKLLADLRHPDNLDFAAPEELAPILRDYQLYGFQWLKTLAHYHFGGILADDMGLGKTLQSIAYLLSVQEEIRERKEPALIVCPASLVYNWRNELRRFAPGLALQIADGVREERDKLLQDVSGVDVVITSYPLLRRDLETYAGQAFHTLFLDEAQMIKNHYTQTAQAVKAVRSEYCFALTGTPVENRLEELWSIYDIVFPGLFPVRKAFGELTREQVAMRIRPFLLRRMKTDVLKELPDKIETLQTSELLPEQKKLYVAYLAKLQQETVKHLDKDTSQQNRIRILAGLTRLRQLCCHPGLFVQGYTGGSAKLTQLLEIVEECRSAGKRMLIFSQFTEMLGLIGRELNERDVAFFYLDGQTPGEERVQYSERFNAGEREVFLVSLKAGGTGLNLTGADTVILYDLWWNPAVEQQAADRAHRMGQKQVVQVIRLVTQGTVEEKMHELQERKRCLIDEVIQPGGKALSALSLAELREVLQLDGVTR